MDGLEVKVQLGTVWKQSLTELSGGQRYGSLSYLRITLLIKITQIFDSPFPYYGTLAVQASADVYSWRDWCSSRPFAYPTYRPTVPDTVQRIAIHCRLAQGRTLHECQCPIPRKVPWWHIHRREDCATIYIFIVWNRGEWKGWRWPTKFPKTPRRRYKIDFGNLSITLMFSPLVATS